MPLALITVDADLQIKQLNENALTISTSANTSANTSVLNTAVFESFPMLQSYSKEIITALRESRTVTLERVPYLVEDLNCYYKVSCYPLSAIPDVLSLIHY